MTTLSPIALGVVIAASLVAATTDVWKFKVYNLLTFPLLLTGLVYHAVTGGWAGLGMSLLGFLCGFGLMLILYVMGGLGAGDLKFVAAIGAWLGPMVTLQVLGAGCIVAGVYAVALMYLSGEQYEMLANTKILMYRLRAMGRYLGSNDRVKVEVSKADRRKRLIPFSAMVTVGLILLLISQRYGGG